MTLSSHNNTNSNRSNDNRTTVDNVTNDIDSSNTISTTTNSSGTSSIRNRDMLALKHYITAKDDINPYVEGSLHVNTLLIDLTHSNLQQRHIEQRFDRHDTLHDVKIRIHQKTGTPPHFQRLVLKSGGQVLQEIPATEEPNTSHDSHHPSDRWDDYKLGYFFGGGGNTSIDGTPIFLPSLSIHCVDINPHSVSKGGQLEDTSLVEKYTMSEQEYDARSGTLRDWSRRQRQKDETFSLRKHAQQHRELCEAQRQHKLGLPLPEGFVLDSTGKVIRDEPDVVVVPVVKKQVLHEEHDESSVANMTVGQRCQVRPGKRRGTVAYIGLVPELNAAGYWVGVIFDEPVGKTDGTAGSSSKRYFEAMPNYGGFVRGNNVQVGDFPERDILDDDDDDDDDDSDSDHDDDDDDDDEL
ncbi:CAP gly-rich domain containing protein [Nitzschia inconspicua]|uniref:CAP gly-rich domain containing protein n=1 Tax=Nitzschia inconspicua TaxID=303405 RepID=A0A9K3LBT4_9STRA|nr:CAP gly-rich domain containing protein [Nitzschia inconspicua]